jgi:carbon storage regulator
MARGVAVIPMRQLPPARNRVAEGRHYKGKRTHMLILTRRPGETIVIGDNEILVTVLSHDGNRVRLGITAPDGMPIHREEVAERIRAQNGGQIKVGRRQCAQA